jgi:hypothetical protein
VKSKSQQRSFTFINHFVTFLTPGSKTISLTIVGVNGCSFTENASVQVDDCVDTECGLISVEVLQESDCYDATGQIKVDVCQSCGTTYPVDIFYTVNGQEQSAGPFQSGDPTIDNLGIGVYSNIFVKDAAGCKSNKVGPVVIGADGDDGDVSDETCGDTECIIIGYQSSNGRRSFWIPGIPGVNNVRYEFDDNGGTLRILPDGRATLTGRILNLSNPSCGFDVNFEFAERRNWTEWSALGRSWKGDPAIVGSNFEDWDYYEILASSTLEAFGCLSGTLNISHKPADKRFGVQVGQAANAKNELPGISAWFFYDGEINGDHVNGSGDINAEGACGTGLEPPHADVPALTCPPCKTVLCEEGTDPSITGEPVFNCPTNDFTVSYTDEETGTCPVVINRTWKVEYEKPVEECNTGTIVRFGLDCEHSNGGGWIRHPGFRPSQVNQLGCSNVHVSNFTRDNGGNSCVDRLGTDDAICTDGWNESSFDEHKALKFTIGYGSGDKGFISGFHFYEFASPVSGWSGQHQKYPTKYGIKVKKNGSVIFSQMDIPTTQVWSLEQFNFPNSSDFRFNGNTTFEFLLAAYHPAGSGTKVVWDVDEIKVNGACCRNTVPGTEVATCVQEIQVLDDKSPELSAKPSDITVECDEIPLPQKITASDNCDHVDVEFHESIINGSCEGEFTLLRSWRAEDDCGNFDEHTQNIHVIDTKRPGFITFPANKVVDCNNIPPLGQPEATDNCDDNPHIEYLGETRLNGDCPDSYKLVREWKATDDCGNTITRSQEISVIDDSAPIFDSQPTDITVACDAIPMPPVVTVSDNCDPSPKISLETPIVPGSCDNEFVIVRRWYAEDRCGNVSITEQRVNVFDDTPPSLIVPDDVTLECDISDFSPEHLGYPTGDDNCCEEDISYKRLAYIDLPDEVTISVETPGTANIPSYFDLTVTNGGVLNGFYDSYCLDAETGIQRNTNYRAKVFSSYEKIPNQYLSEDALDAITENYLDNINWIVNNIVPGVTSSNSCGQTYTYGDVQRAILFTIQLMLSR